MNEKISVIVPVYNVEVYLERCLDSIINNTYRNLEIICVDDGSPDGCGAILDRYAQMDERFVVIHRENGGLSAARNSGMGVATGDFIAFIDSDDWIHPQYFEILLYCQRNTGCDLAICGFARPREVETYTEYDLAEIATTMLNLEGIYRNHAAKTYACGKLYRTKLVAESRFDEGIRIAEDAAFNVLVLGKCEGVKACYISLPLYSYFDRPGSLAYMLKGKETLTLGEVLERYAKEAPSIRAKKLCLIEALKRGLSARYGCSLLPDERAYFVRSDQFVRRILREYLELPNASLKEKVQYAVLGYLPFAYRLFRIIDDPTLLQMEKRIKKRDA